MVYDAIIIGGGAGGLTAGLYLSRANMNVLLLEKGITGGLTATTDDIENYPGFPDGIDGPLLMDLFRKQAEKFGLQIKELAEVVDVDLESNPKIIKTKKDEFQAHGVIISTGTRYKKLGVRGEQEFAARGVSYCAICDGAFFKDKKIAVVGGGDSAVKEAIYLTRFASSVTIIHRRDELRADKINESRARSNEKIKFLWDTEVKEILGSDESGVERLRLINKKENEIFEENFDGVFIYIGQNPNTQIFEDKIELDERKFVVTDQNKKTSLDGVYAIGDVRAGSRRQTSISVGDGATAAIELEEYIDEKRES